MTKPKKNTGQSPLSEHDYDVVIAGSGMAGMSAAIALAQHDISVCLIDQNNLHETTKLSNEYGIRVSALSEKSCTFLENLGLWDVVDKSRTCRYDTMEVWDAESTGHIQFDANQSGYPHLGYIVENQLVLNGLFKIINSLKIPFFNLSKVVEVENLPEKVAVTLSDHKQINAKLLIAADGACSTIRKTLSIPTYYRDCLHHAVVCNITTEKSHKHCARQFFLKSGPLAFLPLSNGSALTKEAKHQHISSIVWSLKPKELANAMALDDAEFCQLLRTKGEHCLGDILEVTERKSYPLRQMHALDYYKGRTVMVADAAHVVHPLAGQGINIGFIDVAVLVEEVLDSINQNDNPYSIEALKNYCKLRKKHNKLTLAGMEFFQQLFDRTSSLPIWLRGTGMNIFNKNSFVKKQIARYAMGYNSKVPALMQAK